MKRFFNLFTSIMLAAIAIAIISVVLSPTINWLGVNWMVIAAIWVAYARLNQMTAEDWKQHYDSQTSAFNTLKQTLTNTADELAELRGKYQALDNDYLKLAKRNEATSMENAQLHERVDDLRKQNSDYAEKYQAAVQDLDDVVQKDEVLTQSPSAQKPGTKETKKEYTKWDIARIREEMKTAGLESKFKKLETIEEE